MARIFRTFLPLALIAFFQASLACTDDSCVDADCKAGNKCVQDGKGETKCRLVCGPTVTCPFNYTCVPNPSGTFDYCAAMRAPAFGPIAQTGKGQWGSPCKPSSNPTRRLDGNPECDGDQDFWCHGKLPTDGEAYCTQFQCETDLDCAQGFACEDVNLAPNAISDKPVFGQPQRVCQKRAYCSDCKNDSDCYPVNGSPTHCISGDGDRKFCSTECSGASNCGLDSKCIASDEAGTNVCFPRGGSCHGDGSFCSPCRSDADCTQNGNEGVCYMPDYSNERFCTAKSKTECRVVNDKLEADCPKAPTGASAKSVTCFTGTDPTAPKNQCVGLVQWGVDKKGDPTPFPGCWIPNRTE